MDMQLTIERDQASRSGSRTTTSVDLRAQSSTSGTATAEYIGDLTGALARMAQGAGFELLARILDMAQQEAGAARGLHGRTGRAKAAPNGAPPSAEDAVRLAAQP